jgi:hypothetical protein
MEMMMMMMMMMMMFGVVASAGLAFFMYQNDVFDVDNDNDGDDDDGDSSGGENCVPIARKACDDAGKTGGDERGACIKKEKEACMAIDGNYWDVDEGDDTKAEDDKYVSLEGKDVLVPAEVRGHTSEDCVYFYDYHPPWTSSAGGVRAHGRWCLSDGKQGEDIPIWETKNKSGDLGHKSVDYIRLGKNIKLTVYGDHHKPDGVFVGKGTNDVFLGSDWGNNKLLHMRDHGAVKADDIDGFKIEKL